MTYTALNTRELSAWIKRLSKALNHRSLRDYLGSDPIRFPEIFDAFIWGPDREFTGVMAEDSHRRHDVGKKQQQIGPREYYRAFDSYETWAEHARTASALSYRLAGAMEDGGLVIARMTAWASSLESAAVNKEFSPGQLRAGTNAFDPLGILADMSGAAWEWSDREEAFETEGNAYILADSTLAEFLDIEAANSGLLDVVLLLSDMNFKAAARTLRGAINAREELDRAIVEIDRLAGKYSVSYTNPPSQYLYRALDDDFMSIKREW